MPRPRLAPRRYISIYLEENLHAELRLLHPELQDVTGYTKYGAISKYFEKLVREDLERIKTQITQNQLRKVNVNEPGK